MNIDPELERIAEEVVQEHGQSEAFKDQFLTFYNNAIENNLGRDLKNMIDRVELPEEEKVDES